MMSLSYGPSGKSLVMSMLRMSSWGIQQMACWFARLLGLMADNSFGLTLLHDVT